MNTTALIAIHRTQDRQLPEGTSSETEGPIENGPRSGFVHDRIARHKKRNSVRAENRLRYTTPRSGGETVRSPSAARGGDPAARPLLCNRPRASSVRARAPIQVAA